MRLPTDSQRISIYGKTGSGKTVGGLWQLEKRSWLRMPWTVIDFKGDPIIGRIPRLDELGIEDKPPRHAGLYAIRPLPDQDDDALEQYMWRVWEKGRHGLFVDEAFMIPRFSKAWKALLTQGRAKTIPIIALSQRPSWLSPFQMSESDFHQVFHLQRPSDQLALKEWVPGLRPHILPRDRFCSYWYDDSAGTLQKLAPVPDEDEILNRFDLKMPRPIRHFSNWLSVPAVERKRR